MYVIKSGFILLLLIIGIFVTASKQSNNKYYKYLTAFFIWMTLEALLSLGASVFTFYASDYMEWIGGSRGDRILGWIFSATGLLGFIIQCIGYYQLYRFVKKFGNEEVLVLEETGEV